MLKKDIYQKLFDQKDASVKIKKINKFWKVNKHLSVNYHLHFS